MLARMSNPYARLAPLLLAGLPLLGGAASAETDAARRCARIAADTERLACYDAAFRRPEAATASPPDRFGDNGQLKHDREAKADLPKSLTGQISHLTRLHNGRYRMTLDNEQQWETTQADWAVVFNPGDRVKITRLLLGGYQVSLDSDSRSVNVRRLD